MKTKLHIGIISILLAFLGAYVERNTVPNQQIVIQFLDENISSKDAETTIQVVTEQLQSIGIENILIGKHKDGLLKIIYFSDSDVSHIQSILTKAKSLKFNYASRHKNSNNLPDNKTLEDFQFNVSKIQNKTYSNWGLNGIQVVEFNHKSDRFNNLKLNNSATITNSKLSNAKTEITFRVNTTTTSTLDNIYYKLPEVRAGPTVKGII